MRFTESSEAVDWYEASHDAMIAAVSQAAALGWHAEVWRLAFALRTFLRIRRQTDDWIATSGLGLAAARSLDDPDAERRLCESMSGAYLQAGRFSDCVEVATRAVALAEALGDAPAAARSRHLCGIAHDRLGHRLQAERELAAALADEAYAASPDAMLGWVSIGAIYGGQGRYDECRPALHNALRLATEVNDEQALCVIHHNLAELALLTGEPSAGADHARQEISIARRLRFALREARGNEMLADCLSDNDPGGASQAWRRAIEIYDLIDPRLGDSARERLAQAG